MERVGHPLSLLHPGLEDELRTLGCTLKPEWYAGSSFLSALVYGVLASGFTYALLWAVGRMNTAFVGLAGLLFFALALTLHLMYPGILQRKISEQENHELLFALREMVMDIKSGMTLFDAMKEVAGGGYGYISEDFRGVVKAMEGGVFEREALQQLALKTESDYLKRAVWQMVNALDSGASVADALTSIVDGLESLLYRRIRGYSSNLNFIMLLYMLIAAAIPSLGTTFLVLLSAFSGAGVEKSTILLLLGMSWVVQLVVIGFAHSTRPAIFGG